ncbi:hypothetical protein CRG98_031851 [Punica granatum]|uniref:Reverse transcriptase domain-containing protein n=1 Tax=Punica granatum TaxID=22663 RepID=A0A2I0IUP5_PUNGR|nr:hypothetical protein CRG98_031851 [Punica granatum]
MVEEELNVQMDGRSVHEFEDEEDIDDFATELSEQVHEVTPVNPKPARAAAAGVARAVQMLQGKKGGNIRKGVSVVDVRVIGKSDLFIHCLIDDRRGRGSTPEATSMSTVAEARDQNSSFFFGSVKAKYARDSITMLFNDQGVKLQQVDDIKQEAVQFYTQLLGQANPVGHPSVGSLQEIVGLWLNQDACLQLEADVTEDEIQEALFSMNGDKSQGPDGFTTHFFKTAWSIIRDDFFKAARYFFQMGKMNREANSTINTLVPKKVEADRMKDFLPISCCNTFYKCITKVLANRIKGKLPSTISKSQSAFIRGRRIADNILLAHELVKGYNRASVSPRCAIKVDPMKAFDSLGGDFILNLLRAMGFPEKFVIWIEGCITHPYLSVSVNGSLNGYFPRGRGLRQGDPLSPMECLSCLLGVKSCRLGIYVLRMTSSSSPMLMILNKPRDGCHTSFWFDSWLPVGPLITYCANGVQRFPTISRTDIVASVFKDGVWRWPRTRDPQARQIIDLVAEVLITAADEILWRVDKAAESRDHLFFSCPVTGNIWLSVMSRIGVHRSSVSWYSESEWIIAFKGSSLICSSVEPFDPIWKGHYRNGRPPRIRTHAMATVGATKGVSPESTLFPCNVDEFL